ncbi:MAG: PAS domain-containing protein [Rhizobiaceae bacterium]|nr:PAS domain-containing protein [Rhizobiaceae bacterium]
MGHQDKNSSKEAQMPEGISTAALAKVPLALVLTNPHLPDNPIVYANQAFVRITRYAMEAVIGRNCRFLQGEDTDPAHLRQIGEALKHERDISLDIVNYRADGTSFLNRLMITPLYDTERNLQCFLGVQRDLSEEQDSASSEDASEEARRDAALGEIQHRVKNHLAMIIGMIRMQARVKTSEDAFNALARRIESLQLLYQEMTEASAGGSPDRDVALGAYVSRIAATIGHLDGRVSVRINVDCDAIDVNVERAARIGLLFSELLTNALKHAFEGREEGLVEARLKMLSSGVIRLTVTDDGIGLPPDSNWPHSSPAAGSSPSGQSVQEAVDLTDRNDAREIAQAMSAEADDSDEDEEGITGEDVMRAGSGSGTGSGLGGRITLSLVRGLGAKLDVNSETLGTTVTVDIPAND